MGCVGQACRNAFRQAEKFWMCPPWFSPLTVRSVFREDACLGERNRLISPDFSETSKGKAIEDGWMDRWIPELLVVGKLCHILNRSKSC